MSDEVVNALGEGQGPAQASGNVLQCLANHLPLSIRDQPVVFNHARCDSLEIWRELMMIPLQDAVNIRGITFERFWRMICPGRGEKVIVENVDDDAASMAEFRVKSLPASAGVRAILGEAVDTAMQVQAHCQSLWIVGRDAALDKVTHQTTELKLGIFSRQVQMNKVIQSLRTMLCSLRILTAVNSSLVICCSSNTACGKSFRQA